MNDKEMHKRFDDSVGMFSDWRKKVLFMSFRLVLFTVTMSKILYAPEDVIRD